MGGKKKKQKKVQPEQYVVNPLKNMMRDYHVYVMTKKERVLNSIIAFLVGGIGGLVFYGGLFKEEGEATAMTAVSNCVVFVLVGIIAVRIFLPIRSDQLLQKQKKTLRMQFRDMLGSVSASLSAGDTVIEAFSYAYRDMCLQYSPKAYISLELEQLELARKNNMNPEAVIDDLAKRSALDDIENFANVFKASYAPGGRMKDIMVQTHDTISEKMIIEDEIEAKMSANKLELNVITFAPAAMMLLLRFSSSDFSENFASPVGVGVITGAIVLFVFAYRMGQKIIHIQ